MPSGHYGHHVDACIKVKSTRSISTLIDAVSDVSIFTTNRRSPCCSCRGCSKRDLFGSRTAAMTLSPRSSSCKQ